VNGKVGSGLANLDGLTSQSHRIALERDGSSARHDLNLSKAVVAKNAVV
jgi:hypothetical protein